MGMASVTVYKAGPVDFQKGPADPVREEVDLRREGLLPAFLVKAHGTEFRTGNFWAEDRIGTSKAEVVGQLVFEAPTDLMGVRLPANFRKLSLSELGSAVLAGSVPGWMVFDHSDQ